MDEILKIIGLIAFSSVKFFISVPAIVYAGYGFWETFIYSVIGGSIGFFAFFYLGELIKVIYQKYFNKNPNKVKKKFTKKNRFIINIKSKYGLIGLSLMTPPIFSVPLGSLLAARYFDDDKRTIPYMLLSIVLWAFALTAFFQLF